VPLVRTHLLGSGLLGALRASMWVYLTFLSLQVSLQVPRCAGAVLWLSETRIPVSRREEVLVLIPGDGRRHHSTAPAAGRDQSLAVIS
jgi:hypothetical protein